MATTARHIQVNEEDVSKVGEIIEHFENLSVRKQKGKKSEANDETEEAQTHTKTYKCNKQQSIILQIVDCITTNNSKVTVKSIKSKVEEAGGFDKTIRLENETDTEYSTFSSILEKLKTHHKPEKVKTKKATTHAAGEHKLKECSQLGSVVLNFISLLINPKLTKETILNNLNAYELSFEEENKVLKPDNKLYGIYIELKEVLVGLKQHHKPKGESSEEAKSEVEDDEDDDESMNSKDV